MLRALIEKVITFVPARLQNTARQFLKFGVTGVIGAIVDFGTYNLLVRVFDFTATYTVFGLDIIVANNISVFLAIISNFIFNKYWTFRDRNEQVLKQWTGFFAFNFVTWVLNQILVGVFSTRVDFFVTVFGDQKDNAAKVAAIGIILFLNFFGSKFLIFRKQQPANVQTVGPTSEISP